MQKVKAFLTRTVWKKVKVWHLLLVLFIMAGANDESSSNSTEYHNLGGGYGDEYSWLQINPDGTAAIFNSKKKNGKPDGLKSCLANGTWTKVNGKKKVRGFSNANCPWVSRHNNTEW